jgi:hypothetical protein
MRFTLTYIGELPATGNRRSSNPAPKLPIIWAIRNDLATQLEGVFLRHPAISGVGSIHSRAAFNTLRVPVVRSGFGFLPLVRPDLETVCDLKIKMLVNHEVGSVVTQAGDLDNRIKTLLDALRLPKDNEFFGNSPTVDPCPCLLHDDAMVVDLCVSQERWYSRLPQTEKEVQLHLEVQVRTARPNFHTPAFGIE